MSAPAPKRKTADERTKIDARIRIDRLKSPSLQLDALEELLAAGLLTRSILQAFGHARWKSGFDAGVKDANGEDD
jgi:hypothetical protein